MALRPRLFGFLLWLLLIAPPFSAGAETQAPAGTVTAAVGRVTVARAVLPAPAPLRPRDHVFVYDRVTTAEHSLARILLNNGASTVTARERSILTITPQPGKTVVHVRHGGMAIAVVKSRMRPGDVVEIRTPNAIAAIRGTVVVTEFDPAAGTTNLAVLRGLVELNQLDPAGLPVGAPIMLGAMQAVTVTGAMPPALRTLSAAEAAALRARFEGPKAPAAAASAMRASGWVAERQLAETARELQAVLAPGNQPQPPAPEPADTGGDREGGDSEKGLARAVGEVTSLVSSVTGVLETGGQLEGAVNGLVGTVGGVVGAVGAALGAPGQSSNSLGATTAAQLVQPITSAPLLQPAAPVVQSLTSAPVVQSLVNTPVVQSLVSTPVPALPGGTGGATTPPNQAPLLQQLVNPLLGSGGLLGGLGGN